MHMENSIIRLLLRVPEYFDMYKGYVDEIVSMYSDPEKTVSELAEVIRPHVKNDPRFFFTAEQFEKNIAKSAEGLVVNENNNGFFGGFGGSGGNGTLYSYGGENVSITDFLIKRNEVIKTTFGN